MSEVEKDASGIITQVIDISGEELKKQREERVKKQMEDRKKAIIELIIRQTDYTETIATEKLEQWNNNYLHVIKEYMNPNFQKESCAPVPSSTKNQMIYGEIRHFMDDVNRQQLQRKRQAERLEQKRLAYLTYLQNKKDQEKEKTDSEDN